MASTSVTAWVFSARSSATPHLPITPVLQLHHHMSCDGVVLQRIHREVLTVTGRLETAMRHLVHQHEVSVDPSAAVLEARRRRHAPADVCGPHRGGEPVIAIVGPANCLV